MVIWSGNAGDDLAQGCSQAGRNDGDGGLRKGTSWEGRQEGKWYARDWREGAGDWPYFSSREIGLRCMKLQNPPRVHSLHKAKERTTKSHRIAEASNDSPPPLTSSLPLSLLPPHFFPSSLSLSLSPSPFPLSPHVILSAAGLPEVSYGRELCVNWLSIEPSVVE